MATQNVCRYFKFGFCKYTVNCRFLHVKENCESQDCDVSSCNLRHPKICRFFRDYSRCKFGEWCCFRHVHKNIESDKEILDRINNLEKLIAEKDALIANLANKVKFIEEKLSIDNDTVNQITEKFTHEKENIFKCENCEFETNSKRGLQIHRKRKHEKKFKCKLCDEVFESETECRIHKKSHSITIQFDNRKQKDEVCENCGFMSKCIYTMDVHIGKCGFGIDYECGFCDVTIEDLSHLELHLRTCEVYECSECFIRRKSLSEMKEHIGKEHEDCKKLTHLKINLENESDVIFKSYSLSEL